jgi:hypothetical protein
MFVSTSKLRRIAEAGVLLSILMVADAAWAQPDCAGRARTVSGQAVKVLNQGGVLARATLNINIDGSGLAYNWDNAKGLISLCNAAKVYPADGAPYQGSADNATCTGRFMADVVRIKAAGWTDAGVGAVQWYGVVGTGSATVRGRTVREVVPAEVPGGGGFLVSPTTLEDPAFPRTDQRRYVDPLTIATAVIPSNGALRPFGVVPGTLGVAWRKRTGIAVPFIVSDLGPRIGEGSPALARRLAGLSPKGDLTRAERFQGQVDTPDVIWVFFGGLKLPPPYTPATVEAPAKSAFEAWGGLSRMQACTGN